MPPFTKCHDCNRKAAWDSLFRVGIEKSSNTPHRSCCFSTTHPRLTFPSAFDILASFTPDALQSLLPLILFSNRHTQSKCLPHLRHLPFSLQPIIAPHGLPSPSSASSPPSSSSSSVSLLLPYACADTSANAAKRLSKPPAEAEGVLEEVMEPVRWRRDRV